MLDRKIYNRMKKKYRKVASWAVWCDQIDKPTSNMGNMEWEKDEDALCRKLNPNFVFVGLNKSKRPKEESNIEGPWANFHSGYSNGNSFKLRYALKGTPFWGAYMTDIIKVIRDKDSNRIVPAINTNSQEICSAIKNDPVVRERNIKKFEEEIALLGGQPVIVAFGDKAYKFLKPLEGKYKIEKLPHYSPRWKNISKEEYREIVLETLKAYMRRGKK